MTAIQKAIKLLCAEAGVDPAVIQVPAEICSERFEGTVDQAGVEAALGRLTDSELEQLVMGDETGWAVLYTKCGGDEAMIHALLEELCGLVEEAR